MKWFQQAPPVVTHSLLFCWQLLTGRAGEICRVLLIICLQRVFVSLIICSVLLLCHVMSSPRWGSSSGYSAASSFRNLSVICVFVLNT